MVKKTTLIILVVLALLFFASGTQLQTFTPTSLFPVQFIGDISGEDLSGLSSSNIATIGDYRIETVQEKQYIKFSDSGCSTNTCSGELSGEDEFGCSIYTGGSVTTTRTCNAGVATGYVCHSAGCGYYSSNCDVDISGCDSVGNIIQSCNNGRLTDVVCLGESTNVEYQASRTCTMSDLSCGGYSVGGSQALQFQCVNKYNIYYKDELIKEMVGRPENSEWLVSGESLGFLAGVELRDHSNAEIIMQLKQSNKYRSSPRECIYTTNEYVVPTRADSFDINVVPQGLDAFKVTVDNNFGSEVDAYLIIQYELDTVVGRLGKTEKKIINVPEEGNEVMINLLDEVTTENLKIEVTTDIMYNTDKYMGVNIPSNTCFTEIEGIINRGEEGGRLVSVEGCDFVKLGDSFHSFTINGDVVEEGTIDIIDEPAEEVEKTSIIQQIIEIITNLIREIVEIFK